MNKFGILAWPAYVTKPGNPYNYLIYKNIEEKGYPVYEFSFSVKNVLKTGFSAKYRVLHIHWPATMLSFSSPAKIRFRLFLFELFLKSLKLLNKKVVWTVHNLQEHDGKQPELEKILYRILYENVDGFICLNQFGLEALKNRAANKNKQVFAHIPHPHYMGYYPDRISREEARRSLRIPADKFVFLFLGQVRRYKNIDGLVSAFLNLNDSNAFLLIAGTLHDELDRKTNEKIAASNEIMFIDSFIKDEDLQVYLKCADLVVTPYLNIFNSGSVFLNLSFNKPTLAPSIGIFPELQKQVGGQYVKLYNGNIDGYILGAAKSEVLNDYSAKKMSDGADLSLFNPEKIAADTIEFYRSLF